MDNVIIAMVVYKIFVEPIGAGSTSLLWSELVISTDEKLASCVSLYYAGKCVDRKVFLESS